MICGLWHYVYSYVVYYLRVFWAKQSSKCPTLLPVSGWRILHQKGLFREPVRGQVHLVVCLQFLSFLWSESNITYQSEAIDLCIPNTACVYYMPDPLGEHKNGINFQGGAWQAGNWKRLMSCIQSQSAQCSNAIVQIGTVFEFVTRSSCRNEVTLDYLSVVTGGLCLMSLG